MGLQQYLKHEYVVPGASVFGPLESEIKSYISPANCPAIEDAIKWCFDNLEAGTYAVCSKKIVHSDFKKSRQGKIREVAAQASAGVFFIIHSPSDAVEFKLRWC